MNSKNKVVILSIIIVLITIVTGISLSYAYWASVHVSNNSNVLNSGCLNVEFKSLTNDISVSRAYPGYTSRSYTDELLENYHMFFPFDNKDNSYYYFTITNTCTTVASYDVNLETLEGSSLDSKYIYINMLGIDMDDYVLDNELDLREHESMFMDGEPSVNYLFQDSKKLSELDNAGTTLDNALYSNKIYSGVLGGRESHLFSFLVVLSDDADEEAMDKTWNSKVVVNSTSVASTNLIRVNLDSNDGSDSLSYVSVEPGREYGYLPQITRENYVLDYWYLDDNENNKVTEDTIVNKNTTHTLKAKWIEGTLLKEDSFFNSGFRKYAIEAFSFYDGDFNSLDMLSKKEFDNWMQDNYYSSYSNEDNMEDLDIPLYYFEIQEKGSTPVYVWLDDNILYYYSEAPFLYFNHHDGFGANRNAGEVVDTYSNLKILDLSKFRTSKMTDMSQMFYGCGALNLDLSNFDTSNVYDMSYMFYGCKFDSIDLSSFDTSNVYTMEGMFGWCKAVKELDISNLNTSNVFNMKDMFYDCELLESLDLSNFNTSEVRNMTSMFCACEKLEYLYISNFDTSNVICMDYMFADCDSIVSLDLSNFDTSKVTNMLEMFSSCDSLESVNLSSFNTLNVTDMMWMFEFCKSLVSLDLSSFDVSNVENMQGMFEYCETLISINLDGFSPSKVKKMNYMFQGCYSLKTLDLSDFNTSNCTSMWCMFYECTSLEYIDLSGFDTSNVRDMSSMFTHCSSLTTLDLSNFNTSNVTEMDYMFLGCSGLTTLDLSSFNTSKVSSFRYVFDYTDKLSSITLNCSNAVSLKNHINNLYSSKIVICA